MERAAATPLSFGHPAEGAPPVPMEQSLAKRPRPPAEAEQEPASDEEQEATDTDANFDLSFHQEGDYTFQDTTVYAAIVELLLELEGPSHRQTTLMKRLHGAVRCSIPPLAMHAEDGVTAHSSPPPSETGRLRRGDMLGSRWLVRRMLGRGTFSEIYEAYDMSAPRTEKGRHLSVAIKVAREQRSCSMLKTEDAVLRELQGSNCPVAIYVELGRMPRSGLDTAVPSKNACNILYVVMEMLGRNLSEIRKTVPHRRLPVGLVSHLGMQMLDALQALHDQGWVHRDVKPSNFCLAVGDDTAILAQCATDCSADAASAHRGGLENAAAGIGSPSCFLIDFGLARRWRQADGRAKPARKTAEFRGTCKYASIRSHEAQDLGRADDLWSLLYLLSELAQGDLPWASNRDRDAVLAQKRKHLRDILEFLALQALSRLSFDATPDYTAFRVAIQELSRMKPVPPIAAPEPARSPDIPCQVSPSVDCSSSKLSPWSTGHMLRPEKEGDARVPVVSIREKNSAHSQGHCVVARKSGDETGNTKPEATQGSDCHDVKESPSCLNLDGGIGWQSQPRDSPGSRLLQRETEHEQWHDIPQECGMEGPLSDGSKTCGWEHRHHASGKHASSQDDEINPFHDTRHDVEAEGDGVVVLHEASDDGVHEAITHSPTGGSHELKKHEDRRKLACEDVDPTGGCIRTTTPAMTIATRSEGVQRPRRSQWDVKAIASSPTNDPSGHASTSGNARTINVSASHGSECLDAVPLSGVGVNCSMVGLTHSPPHAPSITRDARSNTAPQILGPPLVSCCEHIDDSSHPSQPDFPDTRAAVTKPSAEADIMLRDRVTSAGGERKSASTTTSSEDVDVSEELMLASSGAKSILPMKPRRKRSLIWRELGHLTNHDSDLVAISRAINSSRRGHRIMAHDQIFVGSPKGMDNKRRAFDLKGALAKRRSESAFGKDTAAANAGAGPSVTRLQASRAGARGRARGADATVALANENKNGGTDVTRVGLTSLDGDDVHSDVKVSKIAAKREAGDGPWDELAAKVGRPGLSLIEEVDNAGGGEITNNGIGLSKDSFAVPQAINSPRAAKPVAKRPKAVPEVRRLMEIGEELCANSRAKRALSTMHTLSGDEEGTGSPVGTETLPTSCGDELALTFDGQTGVWAVLTSRPTALPDGSHILGSARVVDPEHGASTADHAARAKLYSASKPCERPPASSSHTPLRAAARSRCRGTRELLSLVPEHPIMGAMAGLDMSAMVEGRQPRKRAKSDVPTRDWTHLGTYVPNCKSSGEHSPPAKVELQNLAVSASSVNGELGRRSRTRRGKAIDRGSSSMETNGKLRAAARPSVPSNSLAALAAAAAKQERCSRHPRRPSARQPPEPSTKPATAAVRETKDRSPATTIDDKYSTVLVLDAVPILSTGGGDNLVNDGADRQPNDAPIRSQNQGSD